MGFTGRIGGLVVALGMGAGLAGCASPPPPPPPPTVAQVKISVSKDANATVDGQGAPVVVRVYQLASSAGFEKAEFYRLMNGDTATLGADLVKKDEYLLAPGTTKEETLTLKENVKALGFFGAFREFQKVTWRAVVVPPEHKTTPVTVKIDASGLSAAAP